MVYVQSRYNIKPYYRQMKIEKYSFQLWFEWKWKEYCKGANFVLES